VALIKVDAEPREVGFDAARLARIDRHFRRYVDDGLLAGWTVAVTRRGRVAHLSHHGLADLASGRPVADDTIWRIYSMTKPVTSVAAMMLYEQGALELTDPVARFIPSFADARVYNAGPALAPSTVAVTEPVRVWHLLTHTSGLTYGFHHAHPVDEMYRLRGFDYSVPSGVNLAGACDPPPGRIRSASIASYRKAASPPGSITRTSFACSTSGSRTAAPISSPSCSTAKRCGRASAA